MMRIAGDSRVSLVFGLKDSPRHAIRFPSNPPTAREIFSTILAI